MGFQAVIKSAASAASPDLRQIPNNPRKKFENMKEKLPLWAFYIGNIICMQVFLICALLSAKVMTLALLWLHAMAFLSLKPPVSFEISFKRPKKAKINRCVAIFSTFFPNIWPLAGPNIEKRGGSLQALARVDRQTPFGTFNFWLKP